MMRASRAAAAELCDCTAIRRVQPRCGYSAMIEILSRDKGRTRASVLMAPLRPRPRKEMYAYARFACSSTGLDDGAGDLCACRDVGHGRVSQIFGNWNIRRKSRNIRSRSVEWADRRM